MKEKTLVIVGAATFQECDGIYYTKVPIANYINSLADSFDKTIWFAAQSQGKQFLFGKLNSSIAIRSIGQSNLLKIRMLIEVLLICIHRPYLLMFLPAAVVFCPILPVLKMFAKRMVVYLAGDYTQGYMEKKSIKKALFRLAHEFPLKMADSVIARGQYLYSFAKTKNQNVAETFPLGYQFRHTNAISKSECRSLLFIGKIIEGKGVGDLISAAMAVKEQLPKEQFVVDIFGTGTDLGKYTELVKNINADSWIHFHGWVDNEEKIGQALKDARVLIVPTSVYPEGVPRVIDEALSCGTPVIATSIPTISREFSNNEILFVEPANIVELTCAIRMILLDREILEKYSHGCLVRNRKWYPFTSAAEQHLQILLHR